MHATTACLQRGITLASWPLIRLADADGGQRIEHHVVAWNIDRIIADDLAEGRYGKCGGEPILANVMGSQVHLRIRAVGLHLAFEQRQHLGHVRVIHAGEDGTIEGHLVREFREGRPDFLDVLVVIQVLAIDIGDDGEGGIQHQEASVAFVGFRHQIVALAKLGIGPKNAKLAADDDGRVQARLAHDLGDHAGGCGLPVGTPYGDALLQPHELREHFPSWDNWNIRGVGRHDFRVVLPDGAGNHHNLRAFDVFCLMAGIHFDAKGPQTLGDGAFFQIRPGYPETQVHQDFGDARHADTANAHEMDMLNGSKHVNRPLGLSRSPSFLDCGPGTSSIAFGSDPHLAGSGTALDIAIPKPRHLQEVPMNLPRIVASITAAGCLATGLLGQDRSKQQQIPTERPMTPTQSGSTDNRGSDHRGFGGGRSTSGSPGSRGSSFSPTPDRRQTGNAPNVHGVLTSGVNSRFHGRDQHWQPCLFLPNTVFWGRRDLMAEIQFMSRQGFVACTRVADDALEVIDFANFPQGWKGYAFVVPAKGTLHVSLNHTNRGWFRLVMMNKWGDLQEGMLQNLIPTGNPEVTFKNPKDEAQAVYVVADDPGWMSSKAYPFQLTVQRSWDPLTVDLKDVKVAQGVWGNHQDMSAQFRRPTWVGFGSSGRGMGWW